MRVALIQLDLAWEDARENHLRADRRLREAAAMGARLAVLPEMFSSGFSMDPAKVAEPEEGPTETFLREAAEGLGMWILAGVPQVPGPRNVAALVSPDGAIQRYTKIHPFSFGDENKHYVAGDRVARWTVEGLRITPFICYDLRFPEPFRATADDTDAYVVIASWPERRRHHWSTLLRARAIENQAFVLGVNRVGQGGGLSYSGQSVAVDPWGEALVEASSQEAVLVVDIDPAAIAEARRTFPPLADRKPFLS
ncbi:MAG: carbon-nitrogen family hydrolase [Pseudomonadota bacterium]|nr:carbon-nitrogen family hydrolase [Pseudomonadota bacterium]